jgi:hypothetical protein
MTVAQPVNEKASIAQSMYYSIRETGQVALIRALPTLLPSRVSM